MSSTDRAERTISKKRPVLANSFHSDEVNGLCELIADLMRGADVRRHARNKRIHSAWQKFIRMRQKDKDWESGTKP